MIFSIFISLNVQVGVRDSSYSDFLVDLHKKEGDSEDCRYGLYDYDYQVTFEGFKYVNFTALSVQPGRD